MLPKSGNITENKYKKYLYHGSTTRIIETVGCTNRIWKPEGRLLKVNLSLNATDKSYSASRKHLPRGTICRTLHVFPIPWRFISFGHTQWNTIMSWAWESFQWKCLKTFIPVLSGDQSLSGCRDHWTVSIEWIWSTQRPGRAVIFAIVSQ